MYEVNYEVNYKMKEKLHEIATDLKCSQFWSLFLLAHCILNLLMTERGHFPSACAFVCFIALFIVVAAGPTVLA